MVEYVRTGNSPRPEMEPLFGYYQKHIAAATRRGKLEPELQSALDTIMARKPERSYGYNGDESTLMDFIQAQSNRAATNARDLIHFRTERSWLERSLNHPYFGMYPLSYTWGHVLPELVEFLVFRPFGVPAPLVALDSVHHIYQAVMEQQAYDPELRKYLADNEPALRAIAFLVPGVPWDLPVNTPLWLRRIAEGVATQNQRMLDGKTNKDGSPARIDPGKIDVGKIVTDTAGYALNPVRGFENVGDSIGGVVSAVGAVGGMLTNGGVPKSTPDQRTQEGPALTDIPESVAQPTNTRPQEPAIVGQPAVPPAPPEGSVNDLQMRLAGEYEDVAQAISGGGG
jgi:hypothetical protein